MITDWEAEPSDYRDAFIVAPDHSRCGLIWEVGEGKYVDTDEAVHGDDTRWGVWNVGFPHPMDSRENARSNLAYVLTALRPKWEQWRVDGHL